MGLHRGYIVAAERALDQIDVRQRRCRCCRASGAVAAWKTRWQHHLWLCIGLLPYFGLDSVDINPIYYEYYRGDSRGIEVTLVDLLVLALAVAQPRAEGAAPYRAARLAYLVVSGSSAAGSHGLAHR
jgi:hypothetical protein